MPERHSRQGIVAWNNLRAWRAASMHVALAGLVAPGASLGGARLLARIALVAVLVWLGAQ